MNDVIAFIEKAMKENLDIETRIREPKEYNQYLIYIGFNKEKCVTIEVFSDKYNRRYIELRKTALDPLTIEISEMDVALFKVEFLKIQEYSKNKVIEYFNNFFDTDEAKPTTINDLDNEDD
jgi:hypothetical protein